MIDTKIKVFTDEEIKRLILVYAYSRQDEQVPIGDIQAFLNACIESVTTGESIRMAAAGFVLVDWDKETGSFSFGLTEAGKVRVEEMAQHLLFLDLDELYTTGYFYTQFDIGGGGHSILIKPEDKEAFLDAFSGEWRKRVEEALQEWDNAQEIE